jgi:phospholipase A1/A2
MKKYLVALALASLSGFVMGADASGCAGETSDSLRLACYDKAYQRFKVDKLATTQTTLDAPPAAGESPSQSSAMAKIWELGPDDKRSTFVVRTYQPNFLLPVHYTSNINRAPYSPTQPAGAVNNSYRNIEAKLQISLRAKIVENLLLPGADLWVAYTQRSLWQPWDPDNSSPFRSTDYQPELIYVVPFPQRLGILPLGWRLRMLQAGFAHQSNGQSDPLSRSWNRITAGAGFENGNFSMLIRANQRVRVHGRDDNPDLADYIGRAEFNLAWSPGLPTLSLSWHTTLNSASRGSLQLDLSYPVFANQPEGLRWYAQLFHGYGETLLDYNQRQTSLGLGLTLFQF